METKLRRGIIASLVVTFLLIVIIIVVWKFKFYDDVVQKLDAANKRYDAASTTAKDLKKNLLAEAVAKDKVNLAKDELDYFRTRFRALDFDLQPTLDNTDGNRNRTWISYMNEYFADYGLAMRRELVSAAQDTDVILNTSLKVEAPPQMPELVVAPSSGFLKPVTGGTITVDVVGNLPDILRFLERVNRSTILMSVGNIKVEGTSPETKATFTITPFLVAKGRSVVLQTPAAAGGTAGTGTLGPDGLPVPGVPPADGVLPAPGPTPATPGATPGR